MKLSETQRRALGKLPDASDSGVSAYAIQESLATLYALRKRKLARRDARAPGSFWSPRTFIRWWRTEAGRQALEGGEK